MINKASVAMLGALAALQGVSAQIKPVDQAVKDGNLAKQDVETVDEMCGSLNGDKSSTKPCTIEQHENAILVASAKTVSKTDAGAARNWFKQWENSKRLHEARKCCIQCKVDAWEKGLPASLTPNLAKWWVDTFYDAGRYTKAWEAEKSDFTALMDEWQWRNKDAQMPPPTNQTAAEAQYEPAKQCDALNAAVATPVKPEIANTTVEFQTMPKLIMTSSRSSDDKDLNASSKSAAEMADLKFYCQPLYVTATLHGGQISGGVFAAPAEQVEGFTSRVKVNSVPPQAIYEKGCQVCSGAAPKRVAVILGQPLSHDEREAMTSQISIRVGVSGPRDPNVLMPMRGVSVTSQDSTNQPQVKTETNQAGTSQPKAKAGATQVGTSQPQVKAEAKLGGVSGQPSVSTVSAQVQGEHPYCE
ncbi:hypothetical protein HRG_003317 [Hirsutella rhossiliensis]|uniref:Uncharacterized protein n=1 Tax=Hirsutella rhossiliensis TaxID=111463 RepID=A0A9P8SLM3_9HYPO|nr:uncharacterized protein HRG_03317 [Hirsutella rhossiliensis]KAH0965301.1 hypothetical protein HRG_03317 [Hirsutella rhossiliensis]